MLGTKIRIHTNVLRKDFVNQLGGLYIYIFIKNKNILVAIELDVASLPIKTTQEIIRSHELDVNRTFYESEFSLTSTTR